MILFLIGVVLAIIFWGAYYFLTHRKRAAAKPPNTRVEFWIYSPAEARPNDKVFMDKMLAGNPHMKKGLPPIGTSEGLVFSDIRLHIATLKRENNSLLFKPDVFSELDANVPDGLTKKLTECKSIIVVRYISESQERNRAYIQFTTHAADAYARLAEAPLILDTEAQRFFAKDELFDTLQKDGDAVKFDLQVSVRWTEADEMGRAFTRGMAKAGLPDIEFPFQPLDQKVLALHLVEESARQCWETGELAPCSFEAYGEHFEVEFEQPRPGVPTHRGWLATLHAFRKRPI